MSQMFLDTQPNPPFMGLYVEEDLALKQHLSGITVTDLNAPEPTPRPVPVWFHNPEREERRLTYPNIIINFLGEQVAHDREHRGWVPAGYRYLQDIPFDNVVMMDYPIPIDFDYVVTASARINQHISQISAHLIQDRLHARFAQMDCPGGTVRRITVMAVSRANGMEADKRIFRQIYHIRIPTEIRASQAVSNIRVRQVIMTVFAKTTKGGLSIFDKGSGDLVYGPAAVATITSGNPLDPSIPGQYQSQTAGE